MVQKFLSRQSVAEFLDVSPATVNAWVDRGVLPPPLTIGGVKRWDIDDLIAAARGAFNATAGTYQYEDPDETLRRIRERRQKETSGKASRKTKSRDRA